MFTIFDVIICIVILLTSVVAFMRGGARDILSLAAWLAASFITVYFYPFLFSKTEVYFVSPLTASLVAIIPSFLASLIIFSIVSAAILGNLIGLKLGILDRTFGACLGFIKGLAIVSIVHFCIMLVAGSEPTWLASGQTYKLTHFGAEIVRDVALAVVEDDSMMATDGRPKEDLHTQFSRMFDDAKSATVDSIDDVGDIQMDIFEEEFINEEIISEEVIDETLK